MQKKTPDKLNTEYKRKNCISRYKIVYFIKKLIDYETLK